MSKILVFLFFGSVCFKSWAQDPHIKSLDNLGKYPAHLIVKWAPLSVFDFKQSIQFAVEYKVGPRVTFQNEIGYINNFMKQLYPYENFENMKGVRTRFETRFYTKNYFDYVNGFYLAPEIFFLHTVYQRTSELGRGCGNNGCDYFERKRYTVHKNVFGYHFKIGYQQISYSRVLWDVYGGLGVRHVFIHAPGAGIEQEMVDQTNGFTRIGTYNEGKFIRPSLSLGIKIGYLLR